MSFEELRPGAVLAGYTIGAKLGQGGMGAVFEARDAANRVVALKVIAPELASDPGCVERFQREARASSKLTHPNVVKVHTVGQERRLLFMVLELVRGGSLADRLRRSGALPWREACTVGAGIARGLAAVHAAGLVHRDLKPANVLTDEEGRPKLADFGLVRLVDRGSKDGKQALTRTGELVGTAQYMAPEQIDAAREVGPAADLYSLGGVLFALLTARPPFEGSGYGLLQKHLLAAPTSPRDVVPTVPATVSALVVELLAKEPAERPATAEAVADRLDALAVAEDARPRSSVLPMIAAGLLALAAASIGLAALVRARSTREEPEASANDVATVASTESTTPSPAEFASVVAPMPLPATAVTAISAAPGKDVLVGCADGRVLLLVRGAWVELGRHVQNDVDQKTDVHTIARTRGGRALSAGNDFSIRVWDLLAGPQVPRLLGRPDAEGVSGVQHTDGVMGAAWIGNTDEILSGGRVTADGRGDQKLLRWSVAAETAIGEKNVSNGVAALAVSPSGNVAITGGEGGRLVLWDLVKHTESELKEKGTARVHGIAFTSDAEALAIDADGVLWRVYADPTRLPSEAPERSRPLRGLAVAGGLLAVSDDAGLVQLREVKTLCKIEPDHHLPSPALCLSFSTERDGTLVLWAGTEDGTVLALQLNAR